MTTDKKATGEENRRRPLGFKGWNCRDQKHLTVNQREIMKFFI